MQSSLVTAARRKAGVKPPPRSAAATPARGRMLPKITSREELLALARRQLDDLREDVPAENRRELGLAHQPLKNIMAVLNAPLWSHLIASEVRGAIEDVTRRQPNGTWVLSRYELLVEDIVHTQHRPEYEGIEVRRNANHEAEILTYEEPITYLILGIELADASGQSNLKWVGGQITQPELMDPAVLAALHAMRAPAPPVVPAGESADVQSLRQMVEALQTQLATLASGGSLSSAPAPVAPAAAVPEAKVEAAPAAPAAKPARTRAAGGSVASALSQAQGAKPGSGEGGESE